MIKKLFSFLTLMPLLSLAQTDIAKRAKDELIINGTLSGKIEPVNYVYAYFLDGAKAGLDSAKVNNGKYRFRSPIGTATLVTLQLKHPESIDAFKPKNVFVFFTEPATVTVSSLDSFSNAKVSGSKANIEFSKLKAMKKPHSERMDLLFQAYSSKEKAGDKEGMASVQRVIDSIQEVIAQINIQYIESQPSSLIIPFAFNSYLKMHNSFSDDDVNLIKRVYTSLSPSEQASFHGMRIKKKMESFAIGINMMAPPFAQPDTSGNPVSLESFKGQYVLLDFWASWCGPCRKENPTLVKVYNQYKEKGFTIVSVSLDRPGEKDKWMAAIQKDGLTWTHLSDLEYWDNSVAKLYKISEVPQNFLIDPSGKVIGKGLYGEELEKELEKLLK